MTEELNPIEQPQEEFDTIDYIEDAEFEFANPLEGDERAVTIRTSGRSEVVPWEEGLTLEEAIRGANLVLQTRAVFYLDDNEIGMETVLPAGAVVTAIGATQKGG